MTTIPSRASIINETIGSLLRQTQHFDDFRVYAPPSVTYVRAYRSVTVCYCSKDLGPVMKLGATEDPAVPNNAIIVTVDDDVIYKPDWLKTLIEATNQYPDEALGFSGWNAAWMLEDADNGHFEHAAVGQTCDVLEGFAGAAYRKEWFDPEILSPPDFARFVDDVWISSWLNCLGIKRRVIAPPMVTVGFVPGLHTAPDFVARNRCAAGALFGSRNDNGPPEGAHK
jgi:hypothetical protein